MKAHRRETWSTRSGNMVLKETLIIILGTIHGQYGQSLMAKVTSMTNLVVSNTVLSSGILLLTLGSEACMPTVGKFLSWQFFFFFGGGGFTSPSFSHPRDVWFISQRSVYVERGNSRRQLSHLI